MWEGLRAYGAAGARVFDDDSLRAVVTPVRYEGLNAVFRAGDVHAALELFRAVGVRMLWHLWPGDARETRLVDAGLRFYEEEPAMVLDLRAQPSSPATPAGFEIDVVRGADELDEWVRVWSGGAGSGSLCALRSAPGFEHLAGRVGGQMVATAAVFHGTRASEVQHVVTLREHRRRGIGAVMTAAALDLARKHGQTAAVLTSSPDGAGVYARLGFEPVGAVRRFLFDDLRR